jgi:hypothetical protein
VTAPASFDAVVRLLDAALLAKDSPFRVTYGPERTTVAGGGVTRIVIDDAGPGADTGGAITSQNAQHNVGQYDLGFTMRVYARSPKTGARIQDHRTLARRIFKFAYGELNTIARQFSKGIAPSWSGGFVVPEDLEGSEVLSGALYEATLSIPDGIAVLETDWAQLLADFRDGAEKPGALEEVEIVETSEAGPAWFRVGDTTATIT